VVTQARSGPDAASVFPDSRKVLYCHVAPGAIVVDEESAQAISVPVVEGRFGGGGLVFVLIFGDKTVVLGDIAEAIENVVGLVGEGFTRVVAEGIKFQIGLAGDDSAPVAFYEAFADSRIESQADATTILDLFSIYDLVRYRVAIAVRDANVSDRLFGHWSRDQADGDCSALPVARGDLPVGFCLRPRNAGIVFGRFVPRASVAAVSLLLFFHHNPNSPSNVIPPAVTIGTALCWSRIVPMTSRVVLRIGLATADG